MNGAFGPRLCRIHPEIGIHRRFQQRLQIRQGRDRNNPRHALGHPRGQHPRRQHARHQMPARRMPGQNQWPVCLRGNFRHRRRNLIGDPCDRVLWTQRVRRHRHRPPLRQSPLRQMRPARPIKRPPIPAMHENHCARRIPFRQEQIEHLPLRRAIAQSDPRPRAQRSAKGRRLSSPARRIAVGTCDIRPIGIGIIQFHRTLLVSGPRQNLPQLVSLCE